MQYELTHDTLAKIIYHKVDATSQRRRKAEKLVRDRYARFQARKAEGKSGGLLSQEDLDELQGIENTLNLPPTEIQYITQSRRQLQRAKRNRQVLTGAILLAFALFSAFAGYQWKMANVAKKKAEEQKIVAENNQRQAEISDSLAQIEKQRALDALDEAERQKLIAETSDSLAQVEKANAQKALLQKNKIEAKRLLQTARGFWTNDETTLAIKKLKEAQQLDPNNSEIKKLLQEWTSKSP